MATASLSKEPATERDVCAGTSAISTAAHRPAPRDAAAAAAEEEAAAEEAADVPAGGSSASRVSRNVATEVNPANTAGRYTQTSRIVCGNPAAPMTHWQMAAVHIRPGYTVAPTARPSGNHARESNQL
jgi:hypothetical protein